jgi:hypothetical protein
MGDAAITQEADAKKLLDGDSRMLASSEEAMAMMADDVHVTIIIPSIIFDHVL